MTTIQANGVHHLRIDDTSNCGLYLPILLDLSREIKPELLNIAGNTLLLTDNYFVQWTGPTRQNKPLSIITQEKTIGW